MFLNKKKWFTLVEVLLVCSIFAIMVTWIILAINRSYVFLSNARLQVRATNFAREWVEMMFNIRDTNWRKQSGQKDKCWLFYKNQECTGNNIANNSFGSWLYVLKEWVSWSWDAYIYAEDLAGVGSNFYTDEWFWNEGDPSFRNRSKIALTWNYGYYEYTWWTWKYQTDTFENTLWGETDFYRLVRVYWVYNKNTTNTMDVVNGENIINSNPKEMRFCVKVFYRTNAAHSTELCSIMTNFEK